MKKLLSLLLLPVLALAVSCESETVGSGDTPKPLISGVTTDYEGNKAIAGKPVTLHGSNFSSETAENKVVYGVGYDAVSLRVTDASETHLVFNAPEISGSSLRIRVSVNGVESDPFVLEYTTLQEDNPSVPDVPDEVDLSEMMKAATKLTIRPGIEWISFHGIWEGQVRNINVVKTTLNEHNRLGLYYDYKSQPDGYNIDDKCEFLDAIVGTNGPMACCHFVRVDGEVKRGANEQDPWVVNAALVIDDNVPDIVNVRDNYAAAALKNKTVGVGGPMLVYNGKIQNYDHYASEDKDNFLTSTHPRTAFGISEDQKTTYHVTVDGRFTSSNTEKRAIGMSTDLLAKLMRGLGCYKALNFDGGGGTAMWIYGQGLGGIVNHPCDPADDGKRYWDNPTLRPCGNAVYIYSDLK